MFTLDELNKRSREEFEQWATKRGLSIKRRVIDKDDYMEYPVSQAFAIWTESRTSDSCHGQLNAAYLRQQTRIRELEAQLYSELTHGND